MHLACLTIPKPNSCPGCTNAEAHSFTAPSFESWWTGFIVSHRLLWKLKSLIDYGINVRCSGSDDCFIVISISQVVSEECIFVPLQNLGEAFAGNITCFFK